MPTEKVLIEFIADTSDLKSANTDLEKIVSTEATAAAATKKHTDEINKQKVAVTNLTIEVSEEQAVYNKLVASMKDLSGESKKAVEQMLKLPASELDKEFKRLGLTADQFLKVLSGPDIGKARARLAELRTTIEKLTIAGVADSEMAKKLSLEFKNLKEEVDRTQAKLKVAGSDTRVFDGLINALQGVAGGFAVVQGAQALFGAESEELQQVMVKLQGVFAILQGLQQIQEVLNEKSAASQLFMTAAEEANIAVKEEAVIATAATTAATEANTVATTLATAAQRIWNTVLAFANPITAAIAIAVTAAALAYKFFTQDAKDAAEAQKLFNLELEASIDINKKVDKSLRDLAEVRQARLKAEGKTEAEIRKDQLRVLGELVLRSADRLADQRAKIAEIEAKVRVSNDAEEIERLKKSKELLSQIEEEANAAALTQQKAFFEDVAATRKEAEEADKKAKEKRKKDDEEAKKERERLLEEERKRLKRLIDDLKLQQIALREDSKEWRDLAVAIETFGAKLKNVGLDALKDESTIALNNAEARVKITKIMHQSIEDAEKEHQERMKGILGDGATELAATELKAFSGTIADEEKLKKNSIEAQKILDKQALDERIANFKKWAEFSLQIAGQIVGIIGELFKQESDRQLQDLSDRKKQVEELRAAGAITEKEAIQRMKKLDAEEKKIKLEAAKRDKQIALYQAIINTAAGIAKAIPDIPLMAIAAAIGALQIGLIAGRPLPKFRSGKPRGGFEGLGIVGESGAELVETSKGGKYIAQKQAIVWLNKSDRVYNPKETQRYLNTAHLNALDSTLLNSSSSTSGGFNIDYDKLGKAVGENVPQTIWGVKNGEFVETIKHKQSFTTYLSDRRK